MLAPSSWVVVLIAGLSGCAAPGISALNYSVREVAQRTRGDALDAAEVALVNLDFVVARRDLAEGFLETRPLDGRFAGEAVDASIDGGRSRRVVQVRLEESATGVRVFCKVSVQAQSTQSYRLLSGERSGDDRAETTPIDRDAATTSEQNSLWQTVRRDKAAERAVLAAMLRALGDDAEIVRPPPSQ